MPINNTPEVSFFLYGFFNSAANLFSEPQNIVPEAAVKSSVLSQAFRNAAFSARKGDLPDMEERVDEIAVLIQDADMAVPVSQLALMQKLFYSAHVRPNAALQRDLDRFSQKIFDFAP